MSKCIRGSRRCGRAAAFLAAIVCGLFSLNGEGQAHALAQRYDLPMPLGYFLFGAGAAVAATFVLLALFRSGDGERRQDASIPSMRGAVPGFVVAGSRLVGVGILLLVVSAGFFGNQSTFKNIAPVAVWIIWWIGFAFVCAFIGNVWILINPWAAVFDVLERWTRRGTAGLSLKLRYPDWLGAWPACGLLFLFAWLELVAPGRDVPRNIAISLTLYSIVTWAGFVLFTRETWLRNAEVFSVVFELFGRFAPLQISRSCGWHWVLRPFGAGLLSRTPVVPSMMAFTLLILGTVTVDGLMETPLWASIVDALIGRPGRNVEPKAYMLLQTVLLIAGPLLLAAFYLGAIAVMARITHAKIVPLAGTFVFSLVPIAIAYHLAHYFSLLAIAGQFMIPLVSDPFGFGWDLFGTTLYRIDIGLVDARFVWYLSVAAIVAGHMIAVWISHVTAHWVFKDARMARVSQYPMLVLMVGYTVLSLWILAQPVTEPA